MASLSLPRVLQQRKTSLEIERENFEKCQATAINKAINSSETPVKQKHVRSTIIGTFQDKGAQTFWIVVLSLPLQEDRIVAWKFCHVLHKLLREGHHTTIHHSQRHRDELENLGKLWVHLKDSYGKLIRFYCNLLITKLDFHRRNPRFPGNLSVTPTELENIGENDINNYFQMSVEMFDYMDTILELQNAIFGSIDRSRSNSMTSSGQCRLSPLISCIQDASKLYDFCVKFLFKLHSTLPADTLSGHRERFLKQFKELKLFYQNSSALQYFKNLITIPQLPENPPNFLIQSELRTYITPVVIIPPEEPEIDAVTEGILIDSTIDSNSPNDSVDSANDATLKLKQIITEKDNILEHLHHDNKNLKLKLINIEKEHRQTVNNLQEQIRSIEMELATRDSELIQERQLKEDLFQQAAATAHSQDSEQKVYEEKCNKWKTLYAKRREEIIQLIRQKAEVEKKLSASNKIITDLQVTVSETQDKLNTIHEEHNKEQINLQQSASIKSNELQKLREDYETMKSTNDSLEAKIKELTNDNITLNKHMDDENQDKLNLKTMISDLNQKLAELQNNLDSVTSEAVEKDESIILACIQEAESVVKRAIIEVDDPVLSENKCSPDYFRTLTDPCVESLKIAASTERKNVNELSVVVLRLAHAISVYVIQGRATANTCPDITLGDKMMEKSNQLGTNVLRFFDCIREKRDVTNDAEAVNREILAMAEFAETLRNTLKENSLEQIADMVENELLAMDKNIDEAAKSIQDMLSKSRDTDSGIKLEVNEKILDTCTKLMQAIRVLVKKSRLLQAEIVAQGKGNSSIKEFYKRNHRWTDGLISAAKAIGTAAGVLLTAADNVVTSHGKLEQLIVAAQQIAASTAQLVVASRVKADRNSVNLGELSHASRNVTSATGEVVATVKNCGLLIEEKEDYDMTALTLHAAKKQEMDTQIRVLELEKELEQNRTKLLALRRHHYQLAGENEGWDNNSDPQ